MIAFITFLIVLSILVFVHEMGHFLVAKYFDIRVDEFGLGYPPKAKKLFNWKGTDFTLNWLPFGGFVKIFGENPNEENLERDPRAFNNKTRGVRALVLVVGVVFNFLFAWILISVGFMNGLPSPSGMDLPTTNERLVITEVLPNSPASLAGLKSGDAILELKRDKTISELSPETASSFIQSSGNPIILSIQRGSAILSKTIIPSSSLIKNKFALGVAMDTVGEVRLGLFSAFNEGLKVTTRLTYMTAESLLSFIGHIFVGRADFSQVTGPVGLVGYVGDAQMLGFVYLLSFTALISLNLAIVNLLPIPALDGGRLFILLIESIWRRDISPKVFNLLNNISFALLLILMLIITFRDVVKLI